MVMQLSCPLCKKDVYSKTGMGCLMCGMPLEENEKDFCSYKCKRTFNDIRSP